MKESETKARIIDINIRPMEESDIEKAATLEEATFSMPWKAADFLEMVKATYAYYFVAEMTPVSGDNDSIVGICGLRNIAGEGEITNVAVDEKYRRCGIGRKLIERALDQCSQLDISDVTLEVRAGNEAAIGLYEKFGFKSEGIRPRFYEHPTEDAQIMWLRGLKKVME